MEIKSFEKFIKENIDYGGIWTDDDDLNNEDETTDNLICSVNGNDIPVDTKIWEQYIRLP